jgi:hypothetical protein
LRLVLGLKMRKSDFWLIFSRGGSILGGGILSLFGGSGYYFWGIVWVLPFWVKVITKEGLISSSRCSSWNAGCITYGRFDTNTVSRFA